MFSLLALCLQAASCHQHILYLSFIPIVSLAMTTNNSRDPSVPRPVTVVKPIPPSRVEASQPDASSRLLEPEPDQQGPTTTTTRHGVHERNVSPTTAVDDSNNVSSALVASDTILDDEQTHYSKAVLWKGLPHYLLMWDVLSIVLSVCFLGMHNTSTKKRSLRSPSPRSVHRIAQWETRECLVTSSAAGVQDCSFAMADDILRYLGKRSEDIGGLEGGERYSTPGTDAPTHMRCNFNRRRRHLRNCLDRSLYITY